LLIVINTEALTEFIRSTPGMAKKILDEHIRAEDGRNCVACSGYRCVPYPCALAHHAAVALERTLDRWGTPSGR